MSAVLLAEDSAQPSTVAIKEVAEVLETVRAVLERALASEQQAIEQRALIETLTLALNKAVELLQEQKITEERALRVLEALLQKRDRKKRRCHEEREE